MLLVPPCCNPSWGKAGRGGGAYLHLSFPGVGERGEGLFLSPMLLLGGGGGVVGPSLYPAFVFGAGRQHCDLCHLL